VERADFVRHAQCSSCCLLTGWACLLLATSTSADEPLHRRIDQLVSARFGDRQPTEIVDDATFLRRVWLDLAGRIPTAERTRAFLQDSSQDKRAREIGCLLAAPAYVEHMEDRFHVILMERRGDDPFWRKFLRNCFEQNQPWDRIVRQVLSPDDQDETARGAAYFYTKRLEKHGQNPVDYSGLTRDVGRLFLGVDLQCAECHNHLFIDDYKQQDFQGLFIVHQGLSIRRGAKFPAIDEKEMTSRLEFVSVFENTKRQTGPRIPFGEEFLLPEPPTDPANRPPAPPFSALELISAELPVADRELFTKNIANRLWFQMMGRGLVEPLDQFHSGNLSSHPQLLDVLAGEFATHKFDIKWFLRELALTDTYQRSTRISAVSLVAETPDQRGSVVRPDDEDGLWYRVANERRLSAEQLFRSTLLATGGSASLDVKGRDEQSLQEFDDLKARFLKAFANDAREPEIGQNSTVKAALFVLNDDKLLERCLPQEGNLVGRLAEITDVRELCDELFLSVFTRPPHDEEVDVVTEYLQNNAARRQVALGHVVWSMLTSIEFCVNH